MTTRHCVAAFAVAIVALLSPPTVNAQPVGKDSRHAGVGAGAAVAQQVVSPIPCTGTEDVLLLQDAVPWPSVALDPLGADVTELRAQGKAFCILPSEALGSAQLGRFGLILIASDQPQAFYDNLFPGGTVHPALVSWVQGGGVLSANLTDAGHNGGLWGSSSFVGGLRHELFFSNDDDIANPGHPIVTGAAPCPGGNCGPLLDVGPGTDLDDWSASSHAYFLDLPAGTTVILNRPDVTGDGAPEPVLIEYPFGAGRVIAALTTTEWRYYGGPTFFPPNRKLLANDIAYQSSLLRPTSKEQCKNGGWRRYRVFKNQGDCVSFVATGGKNPPAGP